MKFLGMSGWKRFLVFFALLVFLNAVTEDKLAVFAAVCFISIMIAMASIIGSKYNKSHKKRK